MSGDDTFIARWSRLKQRAADEMKKPRAATGAADPSALHIDADKGAQAKAEPGGAPARSVESEPAFDPAALPPIESIVAGTDIRAFLQKGVPAALTKAALRRAWTTDPAIRDFIEVAENQWDFTNPTSIPGFGELQAADNVGEIVHQALGNLPQAPDAGPAPDTVGALPHSASAKVSGAGDAPPEGAPGAPGASAVHMQVLPSREEPDNQDTPGVTASQHRKPAGDVGNMLRRKGHGRAMPR